MKFSLVADTLSYMENTTKRLELTQHLVDLFKITPPDIIPKVVYLLQGKLRPDHEGVEIGIAKSFAIMANARVFLFLMHEARIELSSPPESAIPSDWWFRTESDKSVLICDRISCNQVRSCCTL